MILSHVYLLKKYQLQNFLVLCIVLDQIGKAACMMVMKTVDWTRFDWRWSWELIILMLSFRLLSCNVNWTSQKPGIDCIINSVIKTFMFSIHVLCGQLLLQSQNFKTTLGFMYCKFMFLNLKWFKISEWLKN